MKFTTQEDVAAEVRANLARKGWSGRRMAIRLGWTQAYISRRLTGDVPFDVNDLAAIAEILEVPVTAFFDFPVISGTNGAGRVRSGRGVDNSVTCPPLAVAA